MAWASAGSGLPSTDGRNVSDSLREATAKLGSALGYEFSDSEAVRRALTHRSASNINNERLEFLGDSVLGLAVADLLFVRYPAASVGDLTRTRAALVCKETLAAAAREAGVGEYLVLGTGEQRSGGRNRDSILADAIEALLGAMYVDGGYAAVRRAVECILADRIEQATPDGTAKDPKTRLQELLQARGLGLPRYRIAGSGGAAHRPRFLVECDAGIAGAGIARGEGSSRRQAEQRAAARALAEIADDG